MVKRRVDPIGEVEQAMSSIIGWSVRTDVQQDAMRRAECDLPRALLWVLGRLEREGPVRLSELAIVLGLDSSTLSPQISRLERDGLVSRDADPADRRASLLRPTADGRRLLGRVRRARRSMLGELFAAWTAEELARAAGELGRVARILET